MRRVLPWLLLGPLTGPLTLGLKGCLEQRRWGMAAVYWLGIVEVWGGLPMVLAEMIKRLH